MFSPKQIPVSDTLVLVPHLYNSDYFQQLDKKAEKKFTLLNSEAAVFQNFTLISGFLGYPHLLTLLEFIGDVREKQVFFLGTAGSLKPERDCPATLNVTRIFSSSIFKLFSRQDSLDLLDFGSDHLDKANAVSVDIVQRETRAWLGKQISRGMDAVEMELFPVRVYLGKPFYALVVLSDRVTEKGILPFPDSKKFKTEFSQSFDFIENFINRVSQNKKLINKEEKNFHEKESHLNPHLS